jgi:UDPglucose 6-dehydrogenase
MAEMGFDNYRIGRPPHEPEEDREAIQEAIVENGQP